MIRNVHMSSLCALTLAACVSNPHHTSLPGIGTLPSDVQLDLEGTFTFSPTGDLELALTHPCTARRNAEYANDPASPAPYTEPCNRSELDAIAVSATIPWAGAARGVWLAAHHVVFRINWAQSDLDPFADDAAKIAAAAWTVGDMYWIPSSKDAAHIVRLARQAEHDRVGGGASPHLEVAAFEVEGGALRSGSESTLRVEITNRGAGAAYRVVATTRSSLASLETTQLNFGMIRPATSKTRKLRVAIPASETSDDAMLVLVVTEANGFTPANVSRRVKVFPPQATPNLDVRCAFVGRTEKSPAFDAGQSVVLKCIVNNTGSAAATVKLEAAIAGDPAVVSRVQIIAVGGRSAFDVPLTVPRDLSLDSAFEIKVTARDTMYSSIALTSITGVIRKPKMCEPGQLTRAEYDAKIAELRAARGAGDLTQAQFDRYDAELVSCLP
jgi:hypothetical protein